MEDREQAAKDAKDAKDLEESLTYFYFARRSSLWAFILGLFLSPKGCGVPAKPEITVHCEPQEEVVEQTVWHWPWE